MSDTTDPIIHFRITGSNQKRSIGMRHILNDQNLLKLVKDNSVVFSTSDGLAFEDVNILADYYLGKEHAKRKYPRLVKKFQNYDILYDEHVATVNFSGILFKVDIEYLTSLFAFFSALFGSNWKTSRNKFIEQSPIVFGAILSGKNDDITMPRDIKDLRDLLRAGSVKERVDNSNKLCAFVMTSTSEKSPELVAFSCGILEKKESRNDDNQYVYELDNDNRDYICAVFSERNPDMTLSYNDGYTVTNLKTNYENFKVIDNKILSLRSMKTGFAGKTLKNSLTSNYPVQEIILCQRREIISELLTIELFESRDLLIEEITNSHIKSITLNAGGRTLESIISSFKITRDDELIYELGHIDLEKNNCFIEFVPKRNFSISSKNNIDGFYYLLSPNNNIRLEIKINRLAEEELRMTFDTVKK